MRSSFAIEPQKVRASRRPCPRARNGFSLIELMIALAIGALLATWAYPSFQSAILKARRSEALTSFGQLQMAQARHRSSHTAYASLAQLGVPTQGDGRYRFTEQLPTSTGFTIMASAEGSQAADLNCRYLGLQVDGLDSRWTSGPDTTLANGEQENRRCWGR